MCLLYLMQVSNILMVGVLDSCRSGLGESTACDVFAADATASVVRSLVGLVVRDRSRMLRLALFFLVVSLIAALFGFGGISAAAADIARILFFIAIVIFLLLLVAGLMAGSTLF